MLIQPSSSPFPRKQNLKLYDKFPNPLVSQDSPSPVLINVGDKVALTLEDKRVHNIIGVDKISCILLQIVVYKVLFVISDMEVRAELTEEDGRKVVKIKEHVYNKGEDPGSHFHKFVKLGNIAADPGTVHTEFSVDHIIPPAIACFGK